MAAHYDTVHKRIYVKRGKARDLTCVDCGLQALDWSHIHETDPEDHNNYEPRCRSCHRKYDGTQKGVPKSDEARRKMSMAKIGNTNGLRIKPPNWRAQ